MSFAQVQSTGRTVGTNTFTITFGATTAGNLLALLIGIGAAGSNTVDVDVTDNSGGAIAAANGWHTAILSNNNTGGRAKIVYTWNCPALASLVVTVTRQGGISTVLQGSGEEWSGFGTNDPLAATTKGSQLNTTNFNTGTSGTTTEVDALVFAVCQESLLSTTLTVETVTPAWTQLWEASTSGWRAEADYKIVTAGGTQICRWTTTSNNDASSALAAFCLNETATAGVRANQAVSTVAYVQDPSPLRANQVVQSLITQSAPVIRWNQVVLTLVVQLPSVCPDPPIISAVGEGAAPVTIDESDEVVCADPDSAPIIAALGEGGYPVTTEEASPVECESGAIELGPFED